MSSLGDKLKMLDVGEHLVIDIIDGHVPAKQGKDFDEWVKRRTHLAQSRVTNTQRLPKTLRECQFSSTTYPIGIAEDGSIYKFIKIKRVK